MDSAGQQGANHCAESEISRLQKKLNECEQRIEQLQQSSFQDTKETKKEQDGQYVTRAVANLKIEASSNLHSLLLMSDSALPLGSFAFSSGLESLLCHRRGQPKVRLLNDFIAQSLASVARLSLPYLLAAHRNPCDILKIDNDFDACNPCTVARRASIAQGRALVALWDRSFRSSAGMSPAAEALSVLSAELKRDETQQEDIFNQCAHFAPVFGAMASALDIDPHLTAHTFLLSHTKAVLSAAVRAGVLGPFQAQAYLTSSWLRSEISQLANTTASSVMLDAGQVWVSGDIWIGRHELLYSRIFNS